MASEAIQDRSRNARIMAGLGGARMLRNIPMDSPLAIVRMIRQGLPVDSVDYAREHLASCNGNSFA